MGDLNCQDLESRLTDEGDPDVARHLASCERCRRRVAFAPQLAGLIRQAEYEPSLPAGLRERLAARLDKVEQEKIITLAPRKRSWSRPLAGLAALAACLAVVFFLFAAPPRQDQLAVDMVEHHEACWAIAKSPGREEHYRDWLTAHHDVKIPVPKALPSDLAETDRRDCPVGEGVHGPHLMYTYQGQEKVSLYVVPTRDLKGIPPRPENPALAHYKGYNVLTWESGGWLFGLVSHVEEPEMRKWVAPVTASFNNDKCTRPLRAGSPGTYRSAFPLRPAAL